MFKHNKFNTINSYYSTKTDKFINTLYNDDGTVKTGNIRHHPPVIRVWNNSVYSFNKNNQDNSLSKYNELDKLIKSYFNFHNNIKLARSKRMRYLRIKSVSKKLFISRPEVKQTNDKINITVYYFDKIKHNFTRKIYFFNRPDLTEYLRKKKYRRRILIKKIKLLERRIKYSGMKQIKNLKVFNDRNKFKNKYLEQSLLLYFFKYLLSLINIQIYNPINISNNFFSIENREEYLELLIEKDSLNIKNIINSNPRFILWIDFNNYSFEKIENKDINYIYLISKAINYYNIVLSNSYTNNSYLTKLNFISQTNNKLTEIVDTFIVTGIISNSMLLKAYNYMTLKVYKNFSKKVYEKRYNKVSKLTHLSMANVVKFKKLLPALKMLIDTYYNKKTELNMVNLKYFYLNSDIYTQALITKLKKKISPLKIINKSLGKVKVFYTHYNKKQVILNDMNCLLQHINVSIGSISMNSLKKKDTLNEPILDRLNKIIANIYPRNLLQKYSSIKGIFSKKVSNILNTVKYKGILGIRVEAKGRLTRRHKAARSVSHLVYKGNLKDSDFYFYEKENYSKNIPTVLLRNDVRANTQHYYKSSIRRIGSFGIKTWISSK